MPLIRRALPWIALLVVLLCWRGYLILEMPAVFGWDAFSRLWERDQIIVRHWLPIPQLPTYVWAKTNLGLDVLRWVYAFIGSAAAVSAGWYVAMVTGSARTGIMSGALIGVSPFFVKYTTVPYQEGPFLLFTFVGITLWVLQREEADRSRVIGWLAGACLMLAALSRYEGWLLVGILATSSVLSKRFSELPYLGLAGGAMLWWVFTSDARSAFDGPPRAEAAMLQLPISVESFPELLLESINVAGWLAPILAADLLVVGLIGAAWGFWIGVTRRQTRVARELAVLLIALVALTILRVVNAGVLTDRMRLLPVAFALVFFGIAWQEVTERRNGEKIERLGLLVPFIMLGMFIFQGFVSVRAGVQQFQPEVRAMQLLETLPSDARVEIEPREIPNILSESLVGAIFAQTTTLDAADPRFRYEGSGTEQKGDGPEFRLFWAGQAYRLQRVDSP